MNEPDYLLQGFGFSTHSLQNGFSFQVIKNAALKIKQLSQAGDNTRLIDISYKLLPVIEDDKFSSIWLLLLEGLSAVSHHRDVQALYSHINEKQAKVFATGTLPVKILHKLWLSHLPCLEYALLALIEHVCFDHLLPVAAMLHNAVIKSSLAEIASKDNVIYQMIFHMLISVNISSDFAAVVTEITATFCHMVRKMTSQFALQNQMRSIASLSGTLTQLETVLRCSPDPETMSSCSILNTLNKMWEIWRNIVKVAAGTEQPSLFTTFQAASHQQFEDLWCLTLQYRSWMIVAVNCILSCDKQFVESCMWYIAAYHRIKLCSETFQIDLQNFINGLRNLLHRPILYSEQTSPVISQAEETCISLESSVLQFKGKKEAHQIVYGRSAVNLLLMTFLFQSDDGFTNGEEIIAFVTGSTDVTDHSRCVIYHHHILNVTSTQWNSFKYDKFLSFISGLCLKLENENKVKEIAYFEHIHSGLKLLLPDLK